MAPFGGAVAYKGWPVFRIDDFMSQVATMDSRIAQIEQLIEEGEKFTPQNFCYPTEHGSEFGGGDTPEWLAWKTRVFNLAKSLGSDGSPALKLATTALGVRTDGYHLIQFERALGSLKMALDLLLSATKDDAYGELRQTTSRSAIPTLSNRVFVVHGHDSVLKTDVERFLHQIGLDPVVLHRQPDQGQTLIEKFEQHSDVGYAIILLTPDEFAYTADKKTLPAEQRATESRARPNVIFEFGYFVGRLGRKRVCCLHKGDVVLPSDLHGLLYKKVDDSLDSQAYGLIRELKSAGYQLKI